MAFEGHGEVGIINEEIGEVWYDLRLKGEEA